MRESSVLVSLKITMLARKNNINPGVFVANSIGKAGSNAIL